MEALFPKYTRFVVYLFVSVLIQIRVQNAVVGNTVGGWWALIRRGSRLGICPKGLAFGKC